MRMYQLGEFEEVVKTDDNRFATIGAVHATLNRLEAKGFTEPHLGDPTSEYGDRPKRLFTLTAPGKKALKPSRDREVCMWIRIQEISLNSILLKSILNLSDSMNNPCLI